MRIDIIGRPPRLPVADVYLEDMSEEQARRILRGKQRLMPILGDISLSLSIKELDRIYDIKEEFGITINDLRGHDMMSIDVASAQEVDVVQ